MYSNTVHSTNKFTHFYPAHGRHPRTPLVTVQEGQHRKNLLIDLQNKLNTVFDIVDSYMVHSSCNITSNSYKTDQEVLIFNQALYYLQNQSLGNYHLIGLVHTRLQSKVTSQDEKTKKILKENSS